MARISNPVALREKLLSTNHHSWRQLPELASFPQPHPELVQEAKTISPQEIMHLLFTMNFIQRRGIGAALDLRLWKRTGGFVR